MDNEKYIARCLQLARNGEYYVAPNPMVGAVLVRNCDETILGEGWHRQFGGPHAEVNCFRDVEERAAKNGISIDYRDCTLFVSLEPCSHYGKTPPCAKLIIEKGVGRVVVGMQDPHDKVAGQGIQMLRDANIDVIVGVLENECRDLNKRFICFHTLHRPYVTLKWAQTADGFVDFKRNNNAEGGPLVISSPRTKQLVHKMRAENMAIMVGTRTVLLDNPKLLNTRWVGRNPIRVILDRHDVIPSDANVFSPEAETIVYRDNTDWSFVLEDLAKREIHSILVEGGPTLLKSIIDSDIYDEVHIEVGNMSIGDGVPAPEITLDNRVIMTHTDEE